MILTMTGRESMGLDSSLHLLWLMLERRSGDSKCWSTRIVKLGKLGRNEASEGEPVRFRNRVERKKKRLGEFGSRKRRRSLFPRYKGHMVCLKRFTLEYLRWAAVQIGRVRKFQVFDFFGAVHCIARRKDLLDLDTKIPIHQAVFKGALLPIWYKYGFPLPKLPTFLPGFFS